MLRQLGVPGAERAMGQEPTEQTPETLLQNLSAHLFYQNPVFASKILGTDIETIKSMAGSDAQRAQMIGNQLFTNLSRIMQNPSDPHYNDVLTMLAQSQGMQ